MKNYLENSKLSQDQFYINTSPILPAGWSWNPERWGQISVNFSSERGPHDQVREGQWKNLQTKYSSMTNTWINNSILREQVMLKAGHHTVFGNELGFQKPVQTYQTTTSSSSWFKVVILFIANSWGLKESLQENVLVG